MPGESRTVEEGLVTPVQMTSSLSIEGFGPTPGRGSEDYEAGRRRQLSERDNDEGDEHLGRLPWDISGPAGGVQHPREPGRGDRSGVVREHVASSSANFSSGVKKFDNGMGSSSHSSMSGENKGRETRLPFLTTIDQEVEGESNVRWTASAKLGPCCCSASTWARSQDWHRRTSSRGVAMERSSDFKPDSSRSYIFLQV